jgi:hypothetical protein
MVGEPGRRFHSEGINLTKFGVNQSLIGKFDYFMY